MGETPVQGRPWFIAASPVRRSFVRSIRFCWVLVLLLGTYRLRPSLSVVLSVSLFTSSSLRTLIRRQSLLQVRRPPRVVVRPTTASGWLEKLEPFVLLRLGFGSLVLRRKPVRRNAETSYVEWFENLDKTGSPWPSLRVASRVAVAAAAAAAAAPEQSPNLKIPSCLYFRSRRNGRHRIAHLTRAERSAVHSKAPLRHLSFWAQAGRASFQSGVLPQLLASYFVRSLVRAC